MKALRWAIALILVSASLPAGAVTITASSAFDTRCFNAFIKQAIPDWNFDTGTAVNYVLRSYGAAGDDNVTLSPVCGDVAPVIDISAGGLPAGTSLSSSPNSATISGTPTGTGAVSFTVRYDNSVGSAVTDAVAGTITAAGGTGTPIANGTINSTTGVRSGSVFVDCNPSVGGGGSGSDSLDGLTPVTPWGTLTKVSNEAAAGRLAAGTDIWLKGGSTCAQLFTLDADGASEADPMIVGSYYLTGTQAFINSPTNYTVWRRPSDYTYTSPRPQIQGTYKPDCRDNFVLDRSTQTQSNGQPISGKCAWDTAHFSAYNPATGLANGSYGPGGQLPVPTNFQSALVTISFPAGRKWFVMQDLDIRYSAGITLQLTKSDSGYCVNLDSTCSVESIVQRTKIYHGAEIGVQFAGLNRFVFRQGEISYTRLRPADGQPTSYLRGGAALQSQKCSRCQALFEGNDIHDQFSEAAAAYQQSHFLFRGNVFAQHSMSGGASSDMIYEQNIGFQSEPPDDPSDYSFFPFWMYAQENQGANASSPIIQDTTADAGSQLVRRNNFGAAGEHYSSSDNKWKSPILMFNAAWRQDEPQAPDTNVTEWDVGNTLVGSEVFVYQFRNRIPGLEGSSTSLMTSVKVMNNLIYYVPQSHITSNQCIYTNTSSGTLTLDYNHWSTIPNVVACRGSHDVVSTNTGLPRTGAQYVAAVWPSDKIVEADLLPSGGAGQNLGVALTTNDGAIDTNGIWDWVLDQRVWLPQCNTTGVQVPESEWVKVLTTDYCGNARGAAPDIGAREY